MYKHTIFVLFVCFSVVEIIAHWASFVFSLLIIFISKFYTFYALNCKWAILWAEKYFVTEIWCSLKSKLQLNDNNRCSTNLAFPLPWHSWLIGINFSFVCHFGEWMDGVLCFVREHFTIKSFRNVPNDWNSKHTDISFKKHSQKLIEWPIHRGSVFLFICLFVLRIILLFRFICFLNGFQTISFCRPWKKIDCRMWKFYAFNLRFKIILFVKFFSSIFELLCVCMFVYVFLFIIV